MPNNPGTVTVADQAFDGLPYQVPSGVSVPAQTPLLIVDGDDPSPIVGDISPNQPVTVTPQTTPVLVVDGDDPNPVVGNISPNQPVIVEPTKVSLTQVEGGLYEPGNGEVQEVITNNVVQQTYGTGTPANVFV